MGEATYIGRTVFSGRGHVYRTDFLQWARPRKSKSSSVGEATYIGRTFFSGRGHVNRRTLSLGTGERTELLGSNTAVWSFSPMWGSFRVAWNVYKRASIGLARANRCNKQNAVNHSVY